MLYFWVFQRVTREERKCVELWINHKMPSIIMSLWRNVLVFLYVLNVVFEYLQMCTKRQWNKTRRWMIDKVNYRDFRPIEFSSILN